MDSPNEPSASLLASSEASSASDSPAAVSLDASTPTSPITRSTSASPVTTSSSQGPQEEIPHVCPEGPVYFSCPKAECNNQRRVFGCFTNNCFDANFWKNRPCRYCVDTTYEEQFAMKHPMSFEVNSTWLREFNAAANGSRSLNGLKTQGSAMCEVCEVVQPVLRQCLHCKDQITYDCRKLKDGCNNVPESCHKMDRFYRCNACSGEVIIQDDLARLNAENFCYLCMQPQPKVKSCQTCGKEYKAVCNFPPVCWNIDSSRNPKIDICMSCMKLEETKEEHEKATLEATEQERMKRDREEGPSTSGKKKRPQPPPIL